MKLAPRTCRHPPFLKIMDEIQQGLRYVFQTDSKCAYARRSRGAGHSAAAIPASACSGGLGYC